MNKKIHDSEVMNHIKGFSIPWEKSRADVWRELAPSLSPRQGREVNLRSNGWIRYAAAIMVILLSSGLFLRFFERQIDCANGEHLTHQLPDGSTIELNSGSNLSYHPYWWKLKRSLRFEGEAFFMVQKGKSFLVESNNASTEVVGTSFSIYSRDENYKVVCHTGKVKVVSSKTSSTALLTPNQSAQLNQEGLFALSVIEVLPEPVPWRNLLFKYTGTPLSDVLDEIQRQYDVVISYTENIKHYYTGDIDANRDLKTTLDLVCKPFKITFAKISEGEYQVFENEVK